MELSTDEVAELNEWLRRFQTIDPQTRTPLANWWDYRVKHVPADLVELELSTGRRVQVSPWAHEIE
ncbi:MAG: hypothetical protein GWN58_52785 [Anaerolineae bacterium]|nr:hypothetical protein [Deltaproteobacteria bacterium]NIV37792.1 hypothetical protein [Anaerolineae bacterium]